MPLHTFQIKVCTVFFRHNAIAHLIYSVNMTFIRTGKPKNSHDSLHCNIHLIVVLWNWIHISKVCLSTSQPLSPATPVIAQRTHTQSGLGGRKVIHGLRNMNFYPRWLNVQYASSRDQYWVPSMAPSPRVIIHHTWWKVDYTELLPSWKGKGFVLTGIDILDTVPSLYPMFLPNLPPGHLGLFCPLYQQAKKGILYWLVWLTLITNRKMDCCHSMAVWKSKSGVQEIP